MSADLAALCAELRRLEAAALDEMPGGIVNAIRNPADSEHERDLVCGPPPHEEWVALRVPEAIAPYIAALMNTAPTLLEAAERLGRVRCAIEAFGCGCDPEVGYVCEVCSTLGAMGEPCPHERALSETQAVLADALAEADEETDAEARACAGGAVAAVVAGIAKRFRALLPENQDRTP